MIPDFQVDEGKRSTLPEIEFRAWSMFRQIKRVLDSIKQGTGGGNTTVIVNNPGGGGGATGNAPSPLKRTNFGPDELLPGFWYGIHPSTLEIVKAVAPDTELITVANPIIEPLFMVRQRVEVRGTFEPWVGPLTELFLDDAETPSFPAAWVDTRIWLTNDPTAPGRGKTTFVAEPGEKFYLGALASLKQNNGLYLVQRLSPEGT